jgi:hypothetical protein
MLFLQTVGVVVLRLPGLGNPSTEAKAVTTPPGPAVIVNIYYGGSPESTEQLVEAIMAKVKEELEALKAQLSDTSADVLAKLDQLTEQLGDVNPESRVLLDEIKAGVQALDDAVGDANNSDVPPAGPVDEPVPGEPTPEPTA